MKLSSQLKVRGTSPVPVGELMPAEIDAVLKYLSEVWNSAETA